MMRALADFIKDFLEHHGSVVEKQEDESLEVIASQAICENLQIPEYIKLHLSYNQVSSPAFLATYDSDFFQAMGRLISEKGRFTKLRLEPQLPNPEKLGLILPEKLFFKNATYKFGKTETKNISYLLIYFKYTAVSDEKKEGIISILVNEETLSTVPFSEDLLFLASIPKLDARTETKELEPDWHEENVVMHKKCLSRLSECQDGQDLASNSASQLRYRSLGKVEEAVESGGQKKGIKEVLRAAYLASRGQSRERLVDFVKSLGKRLNRDIARVHEYYETLLEETRRMMEKKELPPEKEKLLGKIDVIKREQVWKIQDLISKYALNIELEPILALRIETRSLLFWIDIKRRLGSRLFPITYNPLIQKIDPLPCESCFHPTKPYHICDEKLHIVCTNCSVPCPHCGKPFCSVCFPKQCPRCNAPLPTVIAFS